MVLLSIYIQHGDICLQSLHRLTGARPLCRCATSPRTAGSHLLQQGVPNSVYASLTKNTCGVATGAGDVRCLFVCRDV